jgi:sporulation protein YlmC with PRC-barrel domain
MLQLSGSLLNRPVMSLRTGGQVATTQAAIINPNDLKLEGFYCLDHLNKQRVVLLYQDIRDVVKQGLIINDHDVLVNPLELVRLKDTMALNFELLGKPVVTVSKDKVGKVSDYAIEGETMFIQKLYVSQSILKSLSGGSLSVDRGQIVEITNRKVVINDLLNTSKITAPAAAPLLN